jgi:hypothetical protein
MQYGCLFKKRKSLSILNFKLIEKYSDMYFNGTNLSGVQIFAKQIINFNFVNL